MTRSLLSLWLSLLFVSTYYCCQAKDQNNNIAPRDSQHGETIRKETASAWTENVATVIDTINIDSSEEYDKEQNSVDDFQRPKITTTIIDQQGGTTQTNHHADSLHREMIGRHKKASAWVENATIPLDTTVTNAEEEFEKAKKGNDDDFRRRTTAISEQQDFSQTSDHSDGNHREMMGKRKKVNAWVENATIVLDSTDKDPEEEFEKDKNANNDDVRRRTAETTEQQADPETNIHSTRRNRRHQRGHQQNDGGRFQQRDKEMRSSLPRVVEVEIDPMENNGGEQQKTIFSPGAKNDESEDRALQSAAVSGESICLEAVQQEEELGTDYGTKCSCVNDSEKGTSTLICTDKGCSFCNEDGSICEIYSYGVVFDKDGYDIEYLEIDEYVHGKEGKIIFREGGDEDATTCSVTVDGVPCTSCLEDDCNDGWYGIAVDCMNVPDGTSFSTCNETIASQGIFHVYNRGEYDYCYTAFDACLRDIEDYDPKYDCTCEETDSIDTSIMVCVDSCEYCNDKLMVCGTESLQQIYSAGALAAKTKTIEYTADRAEIMEYSEFSCGPDGCEACSLKVDGVKCSSCSVETCDDGQSRPNVDCSNLIASAKTNFCTEEAPEGSLLDYFNTQFSGECLSESQKACQEAKAQYQETQFTCTCDTKTNATAVLNCTSNCGDLCNDEETVCARETFFKEFTLEGGGSYFQKDIQYTKGRKETLTFSEFEDGSCALAVGDVVCTSCSLTPCAEDGSIEAPVFDCGNIEAGRTLDLCDASLKVETGVFERFSMQEFLVCADRTPTNSICQQAITLDSTQIPLQQSGSTIVVDFDGVASCGLPSSSPGLWYTIQGLGKGLKASTCAGPNDFSTQISVYSGGCASMQCTQAILGSCDVDWFGEQGVEYRIRVHGTGAEVGNFILQVEESNYAEKRCDQHKASFEALPGQNYTCSCDTNTENGETSLSCTSNCPFCNSQGSVCADSSFVWELEASGAPRLERENVIYTTGLSESLVIGKSSCDETLTSCESCSVMLDGNACESCAMKTCDDAVTPGYTLSCTNLGIPGTIDTCLPAETGVEQFQFLTDRTFGTCFGRDALSACTDHKTYEETQDPKVLCDCQEIDSTGGDYVLTCQDQNCLLCNERKTVCGYSTHGSTFDHGHGQVISEFRGFQYVEGRSDSVAFHSYLDNANDPDFCQAQVNKSVCTSCQSVSCDSDVVVDEGAPGFQKNILQGHSFKCDNIMKDDGAVNFDGCSMNVTFTGALEYLGHSGFDVCVPVQDPNEVCLATKTQLEEVDPLMQTNCTCQQDVASGGYDLSCSDDADCTYCHSAMDQDLCGEYTEYSSHINRFGSVASYVDTFQYTTGSNDVVQMHDFGSDCAVSVSGVECSCQVVDCPSSDGDDTASHYSIECPVSEGESNMTFHCGEGHPIFSILDDSTMVRRCAHDPTPLPSTMPSDMPSMAPSETPTETPPKIISEAQKTNPAGKAKSKGKRSKFLKLSSPSATDFNMCTKLVVFLSTVLTCWLV